MELSFQTSAGSSERHPVYVKVFEKGTGISNRIEILLIASQQQSTMIEPLGLDFGKVMKGETYERTVNITEVPTDRFSILNVTAGDRPIRGTFETIGERAGLKTYQVRVLFSPDDEQSGQSRGFFTIETDSLLRPEVQISYSYSMVPDISAEPSIISLGSVRVGATSEVSVLITARNEEEFRCEIKFVPDGSEASVIRKGNPTELLFKATPSQTGIWYDKLIVVVKTSEREEVLEIECVGYVH
jgi:hypothetical protein